MYNKKQKNNLKNVCGYYWTLLLILTNLLTALILFVAQTVKLYFLQIVLPNYLKLGKVSGAQTNNTGEFSSIQSSRGMEKSERDIR